jgi:hypothetical protein
MKCELCRIAIRKYGIGHGIGHGIGYGILLQDGMGAGTGIVGWHSRVAGLDTHAYTHTHTPTWLSRKRNAE